MVRPRWQQIERPGAPKRVRWAVVLIAKCGESHKTYGMRLERTGRDCWLTTWAFPIKESSAKREGYDKVQVKGGISFSDDDSGCPYCGGYALTLCACGRCVRNAHTPRVLR